MNRFEEETIFGGAFHHFKECQEKRNEVNPILIHSPDNSALPLHKASTMKSTKQVYLPNDVPTSEKEIVQYNHSLTHAEHSNFQRIPNPQLHSNIFNISFLSPDISKYLMIKKNFLKGKKVHNLPKFISRLFLENFQEKHGISEFQNSALSSIRKVVRIGKKKIAKEKNAFFNISQMADLLFMNDTNQVQGQIKSKICRRTLSSILSEKLLQTVCRNEKIKDVKSYMVKLKVFLCRIRNITLATRLQSPI